MLKLKKTGFLLLFLLFATLLWPRWYNFPRSGYVIYLTYRSVYTEDKDIKLKLLMKAWDTDPNNSFTNRNIAKYFFREEQYYAAMAYYQSSLKHGFNADDHLALCYCYLAVDQYEQSINCSKFYQKKVPNDPRVLSLLGAAYYVKGDTLLALETFLKAYELSEDCNSFKMIIKIYSDSGSMASLRKFCRLDCLPADNQPFETDIDIFEICPQ